MAASEFAQKYGPWAVVTGAARGIGAAFTTELAARGLNVVMVDRLPDLLSTHAIETRHRFPSVDVRECMVDMTDRAALAATCDEIQSLEIGLLVNNAATGGVGPWFETPVEAKLAAVDVNCAAVVMLTDRLTRAMRDRRRGGVVIMSSAAALQGSAYIASYAATKAYDRVLAESLWAELRLVGIDVTAVLPGATATPGLAASVRADRREAAQRMASQTATPQSVVQCALAALGSKPNVMTGRLPTRVLSVALNRLLPRKYAVRLMSKGVESTYGP